MGWTFSPEWPTRAAIIRHLAKHTPQSGEHWGYETIKSTTRREGPYTVLWAVQELTKPDGSKERFIACYLLERDRDGWGYKDMTESMGPSYYSCPPSYFAEVPDPGSYATEWRKEVLSRAAA